MFTMKEFMFKGTAFTAKAENRSYNDDPTCLDYQKRAKGTEFENAVILCINDAKGIANACSRLMGCPIVYVTCESLTETDIKQLCKMILVHAPQVKSVILSADPLEIFELSPLLHSEFRRFKILMAFTFCYNKGVNCLDDEVELNTGFAVLSSIDGVARSKTTEYPIILLLSYMLTCALFKSVLKLDIVRH